MFTEHGNARAGQRKADNYKDRRKDNIAQKVRKRVRRTGS
jgi:hypothetical protein